MFCNVVHAPEDDLCRGNPLIFYVKAAAAIGDGDIVVPPPGEFFVEKIIHFAQIDEEGGD